MHNPAKDDGLGKAIRTSFLIVVLRLRGTLPRSPALSNSCWNKGCTPAGDPWLIIWRKFSDGQNISISSWSCLSIYCIIFMIFLLTRGNLSNLTRSLEVLLSGFGSDNLWLRTDEASFVYSEAILVSSDGWRFVLERDAMQSWCCSVDHLVVVFLVHTGMWMSDGIVSPWMRHQTKARTGWTSLRSDSISLSDKVCGVPSVCVWVPGVTTVSLSLCWSTGVWVADCLSSKVVFLWFWISVSSLKKTTSAVQSEMAKSGLERKGEGLRSFGWNHVVFPWLGSWHRPLTCRWEID